MYGNQYPPPMGQPQAQPPRFSQSPSDYRAQKMQAMAAEKRSLSRNAAKLAVLLIVYNIMNSLAVDLFYIIVCSVREKAPVLNLYTAVERLRENHTAFIAGTAFRMGAMLFTVILSGLTVLFIGQIVMGADLLRWFKPSKEKAVQGMRWSAPCVTVNLMMSVFVALIVEMLSNEGVNVPEADFSIKTPTTMGLIMQFLYVCIVGPVAEEFIYRGVVLELISPYGKGLAVFVSALFFGLMHGNLSQTVPTFIGGLLFAAVAVRYDSIVPTIIIHICNNLLASISDFGDALNKDLTEVYLGFAILLMVIGFYMLIVFLIDLLKETLEGQQYALPAGKRAAAVLLNVLMIAYMGIFLIYPYIKSFIDLN